MSYTHDAYGRVASAVNGQTTLSWSYDLLDRKSTEIQQLGAEAARVVGYTYDADGQMATLGYPDGHTVEYAYTSRNQLGKVTAGGPPPLNSNNP